MKSSHSANVLNNNNFNKGKVIEFPAPLLKKAPILNKYKKNWLIYILFTRKVFDFLCFILKNE